MRAFSKLLPALVLATVCHAPLTAQTRAEVRGGMAVGSHTATAAGLDLVPRASFEVLLLRAVKPSLYVYGGFVHTAFGCRDGFCLDRDLTVAGNHAALGVEMHRGGPWLRLGLLVGGTEVGSEGESPDLGLGVHASGGLTIGSGRVRVTPGLSYRWLSANTPSRSDHAVALAFDLGVGFWWGDLTRE